MNTAVSSNSVDAATHNTCHVCNPLGACLAFRGVQGAIPFLHGGQGCATYIRRYVISHFREPMDIASSNFGESHAVFGGAPNLFAGLDNVRKQYQPQLIGIATTCLSETIGEDVPRHLHEYAKERPNEGLPLLIPVSTPSYSGTHVDGFHATTRALIQHLATSAPLGDHVNILPGMLSPEDLRHIRILVSAFGLHPVILPDYSETMDGGVWDQYQPLPEGGTPVAEIVRMGSARKTIQFGATLGSIASAGKDLSDRFKIPCTTLNIPVGVNATDRLMEQLVEISGSPMPKEFQKQRGRLVDSYIDGHKYIFGKRAWVIGDEDMAIAMTAFLCEIGIRPVLVATGGSQGNFTTALKQTVPELPTDCLILEDVDYNEIQKAAESIPADILVGNSKAATLARPAKIPHVRVGFPIHDRLGAGRRLHVGYAGAQSLFDEIVNTLLAKRQEDSTIGWSYM